MGFLDKFTGTKPHKMPVSEVSSSSFDRLSNEELDTHLNIHRYGNFLLTDAVRPSYDLQVIPQPGYRVDAYRDECSGAEVPVLMAAASRENLFDLFMDLLDPLGNEVKVVLETSHATQGGQQDDLCREHVELPILKSMLWDYEDLLLNDGCTGIAVLNTTVPYEVQFDEHKMLVVYGDPLAEFERVLQSYGLKCQDDMRFITEAEHVHSSHDRHADLFEQLQLRLGMEG